MNKDVFQMTRAELDQLYPPEVQRAMAEQGKAVRLAHGFQSWGVRGSQPITSPEILIIKVL